MACTAFCQLFSDVLYLRPSAFCLLVFLMEWAYPERWGLFWLLPVLAVFWVAAFRQRRRLLARFAEAPLIAELAGVVDWTARRHKAAALTIGIGLLLLALVGPQWGFQWEQVTRRGVDIVIALDVSKSMLAEDVKPSRLERAKLAIQELMPLLKGDRIGLVAFAGSSFVQCPLTVDYGAFGLILDEVSPDTIPRGGTVLTEAIRTGINVFAGSSSESRVMVLITDGEDHEGDPVGAAKEAAKAGVKVFCIGIGTAEGELIPVTDAEGHQTFLKDREGRTVKSRLNESTLQKVALATGASYVHATATSFGLDLLYRERISKFKQQESESAMRRRAQHRFQWPLALALIILAVEPLLGDRRRSLDTV